MSGLADPLLKGTHLQGALPPHHLQQIPDVSLFNCVLNPGPPFPHTLKFL